MKIKYILYFASILIISACEKDNYDEPNVSLTGRIVYAGEPLLFEANQLKFQLWEMGYDAKTPIEAAVAQDGTFSRLLFKGDYKLVLLSNQAPFLTKIQEQTGSDTIIVNLSGSQNLDIEVTPYYVIRNPQLAASGSNILATLALEKIISDANAKDIERVVLYVNKTQFVSAAAHANIVQKEIAGAEITDMANIALNLDLPKLNQGYVFARVGVKISGAETILYSPVQKLNLQ